MNPKTIVCLFATFVMVGCGQAQDSTRQWSVVLKIVDDAGLPVVHAQAAVSYRLPTPLGEGLRSGQISGLTDSNGLFQATHVDRTSALGFHIEKSGYYSTFVRYELGYPPVIEETNIPVQVLVLKRILQPVPMYAKGVNLGMPVFDEPVGFDLTAGDWVAPHGNGATSDFIFEARREKRGEHDSDYKLTVSFPNPGDGILVFCCRYN